MKTQIPEPWRTFAGYYGGLTPAAYHLDVSAGTMHGWATGRVKPPLFRWPAILEAFFEAGMCPPTPLGAEDNPEGSYYAQGMEAGRARLNPGRLPMSPPPTLEDIASWVVGWRSGYLQSSFQGDTCGR